MFRAALVTIAKTQKQPKCPSTDNWFKKVQYMYTMDYDSAIKKNKVLPFAATWVDLENTILSEVSQTERDKYHMISLICGTLKIIQMNVQTKQNLKNNTNECIDKTETD